MNHNDIQLNFDGDVSYSIKNSDFSTRSGAYLFTIGNTGSGKTTLHQYILKWLKDNTTLERCSVDGHYGPVATIDDFISSADRRVFCARTTVGEPMELKVKIHPIKSPPLELGFFEISGEDIKSVIPTHSKSPELPEKLEEALGNRNIRYAFIFVSDADEARRETFNEDRLFASFLDYTSQRHDHLRRVPLLFVVSKWYGKNVSDFKSPHEYVKTKLPGTYRRLMLMKKQGINHAIVSHYIGTHKETTDDTGKVERVITEQNMNSSAAIVKWVYKNFKNRNMDGRTFLSTFFENLSNPLR